LFFLFPLLIVLKISLAQTVIGIPPYTPLLTNGGEGIRINATFANFVLLAGDDLYVRAYLGALGNAALATALCLVFGYPIAYAIARAPTTWRRLLLLLVMLPFWTSFLIRVYAWIAILKPNGLLNELLVATGLIETPLPLLTVWAGFSTRWYGELARNESFRAAAVTSFEVASMAASLSLVLRAFAGLGMARFARFRGSLLFGFALMAPLVVPEVILGLSLLLLFVAGESLIGWPQSRGVMTITIAHATFGACFVSILVRA
jgi:putrescine transport system permease protein